MFTFGGATLEALLVIINEMTGDFRRAPRDGAANRWRRAILISRLALY